MWSVSLNKSNKISQIFNPNVKEMQPRKVVRKYTDLTHVYCITSSASKESVVRVGLSDGNDQDIPEAFDIFESS